MTKAEITETRRQVILRKRSSGVALLLLDGLGKHNLLTGNVIAEFEQTLKTAEDDKDVQALVVISGKPDNFVSGADLHEIIKFTDESQALALSREGQKLFNYIANFPKPTVAAIHGACLGGGLELALCCTRRIATDAEITIIGLPEVKLGFIPGLGGTQRLPRIAGLKSALEVTLSAEPVTAARAKELNIIDKIVSPDDLIKTAEEEAQTLIEKEIYGSNSSESPEVLSQEKQDRLFAMTERSIRIKTKGKYPAHTRAIEVMKKGLSEGIEVGLVEEAKAFAELSVSDVSRNLVSLFFATEFAKLSAISMAKRTSQPIKTVGIFGGGLMGSTLAQLVANHGLDVLFRTAHEERQEEAVSKLLDVMQRSESPTKGTVTSATSAEMLKDADIIIEACSEDLDAKKTAFTHLSKVAGPHCLLATNTSSLSVSEIASQLPNKENFIGMHFFHPVDRMPLVEVIAHSTTSREAQAKAAALICKLGKTPVFVKDSPTFLLNRVLYCYLSQAARLAVSGVPVNWLEDAAIDFGMPMGPMALLDEVGLDVANRVAQTLRDEFGERMAPPAELARALAIGMVGKKTGSGIYTWDQNGKRIGFDPRLKENLNLTITEDKPDAETCKRLAEHMILPMVDEAARCLDEHVVRRAREIDICTVLGMGFPPFRGGLLRYADELGIARTIERLDEIFNADKSPRAVCEYLHKMNSQKRAFYTRNSTGDD